MIYRAHVVVLLTGLLLSSFTNKRAEKQVQITVSGIEHSGGHILVAVFNSQDNFLKEDYWSRLYPLGTGSNMDIQIDDLPEGEYAISVVHDENGNGELDTNFLGIPKEPFGFSNNPRMKMGPPSFSDSKFLHSTGGTSLSISLSTFTRK